MRRIAVSLLVLCINQAYASGSGHAAFSNDRWKVECGSCHYAYPPQLLTSDNWQQLLSKMDKHFGTNAVLDDKDNKEILEFLKRHAGDNEMHRAASLRIGDTPWFRSKHRSVSSKEWVNPDVKSRSNCTACHIDLTRNLSI